MGIDHIAQFWEDFGYVRTDGTENIPNSKVTYQYLSPPSGKDFPRVVISSIKVFDNSYLWTITDK